GTEARQGDRQRATAKDAAVVGTSRSVDRAAGMRQAPRSNAKAFRTRILTRAGRQRCSQEGRCHGLSLHGYSTRDLLPAFGAEECSADWSTLLCRQGRKTSDPRAQVPWAVEPGAKSCARVLAPLGVIVSSPARYEATLFFVLWQA